jgi:hypothetical protein
MIRLNELRVKAGSARQQHYAGKQGRFVNKHNTGTVKSLQIDEYTQREISAPMDVSDVR